MAAIKPWHVALGGAGLYFLAKKASAGVPIRPIEGPLRPPPIAPNAEPPGPAALRIQAFFDGLSDSELLELRSALPEHWWGYITVAVQMPSDGGVEMILAPARIDYQVMTSTQKGALKDNIITAIGYFDAYELQGILQSAGVM